MAEDDVPSRIIDQAIREGMTKPLQEPDLFTVDLKFQANSNAWANTMTEKLWNQLKNGDWRLLSIGFDTRHGVGAIYIKHDAAPLAENTHAAILSLAKCGEEMFKNLAMRAAQTNQL